MFYILSFTRDISFAKSCHDILRNRRQYQFPILGYCQGVFFANGVVTFYLCNSLDDINCPYQCLAYAKASRLKQNTLIIGRIKFRFDIT